MDTLLDGLVHGITTGSVYAVIALGLAIIYSISGVLNFAHGHLVVLAMYFALIVNKYLGLDPYVASVIVIPIMAVVGILLYLMVFRKLADAHVLTAIQATLGIMFLIEGVLLFTQGGQYQRVPAAIDTSIVNWGPIRLSGGSLVAFFVALVTSLALFLVLRSTNYGRNVRAILQNTRGAQLVGVDVFKVRIITFALGSVFAAIAGILLIPGHTLHPSMGLNYTVIAILAFFIGGSENLFGTFLGGLILGVAESLGAIYIPGQYGFIAPYLVIIFVILARPQGLFSKAKVVKL